MSEPEEEEGIVTPWSSVLVTFAISAAQGVIFYAFFLYQRGKEKAKESYDLYEPRQHKLSHRSPPPYSEDIIILIYQPPTIIVSMPRATTLVR